MKTIIYIIILCVLFFLLGFYYNEFQLVKRNNETVYLRVGGVCGYSNMPIEYSIYAINLYNKKSLEYGDSLFYKSISDECWFGGRLISRCKNIVIRKDAKYYECIMFGENRNHYDFDNLFLATPDTVYRITVKPIKYVIDTCSNPK
jgi:hypothetical protein